MADGYIDLQAIRDHLETANLVVVEGGKGTNRFRRERFGDIEPIGSEWLVKHFLPASGVGILAGPSTVGKSFVILYFCLRIALGKNVLNHRTRKSGVLYVAAEGQNGMRKRIKALRDKFDVKTGAFQFIGAAPNLLDKADMDALGESAVDASQEMMEEAGVSLGLIIIDTTAASMPGGNENAGEDMSVALEHAQALSTLTGALVLLVGHTGKNEELGVRGWSGQIGNSDVIIYLTKDKEDPTLRLGTVFKLKDGESGERFAYRLRSIEMGVDAEGDLITSAYPVFEEAPGEVVSRKAPELKPASKLILRAMHLLVDDGLSEHAPALPGVRAGTRAVKRSDLRARAVRLGYAESTDNQDSARRAFNRELSKLAASEHVRIEGELVWSIR